MKPGWCMPILLCLAASGGCQTMGDSPRGAVERRILVTVPASGDARVIYGGSKRSYHGQEWPVSLHTLATLHGIESAHGLHETDAWHIESVNLFCVVYEVPQAQDLDHLLTMLRAESRIVTAWPMQEYRGMLATAYDDPLFELQYGDHRQSITAAHTITRGQNVRVGVIDSNVDVQHPDLHGQVKKVYSLVGSNSVLDRRHGTAVVGIIGARPDNGEGLVGLAPGAAIHAYAACENTEQSTQCSSFHLAQALDRAIADKIQVLNLSLAGPADPLLELLIQRAMETGTTVIAAGNPRSPSLNFPAGLPGVHAAPGDVAPWFARDEQFSTQAGGGYQVFYGSSISAAGVSGVAALLRTQYSADETDQLLDEMLSGTCDPHPLRSPLLDSLFKIRRCPE